MRHVRSLLHRKHPPGPPQGGNCADPRRRTPPSGPPQGVESRPNRAGRIPYPSSTDSTRHPKSVPNFPFSTSSSQPGVPPMPGSAAFHGGAAPLGSRSDAVCRTPAPPWKAALPDQREIASSVGCAWRNEEGLACLERKKNERRIQGRKIGVFIVPAYG